MDIRPASSTCSPLVLLFAAFRVITARNPVHAALYLVLAFFSAACVWMLLRAEFLAIALVLVYVGAVMVLFLFVVMMLDINVDALRDGFWKHFPLAALRRRGDRARDGGGADRRLPSARGARRRRRRRCKLGNTKVLGIAALHRLPLPAADRGGDPAGGDRRRHRADAAPAQGQQAHRPVASRSRRQEARDRVRIVQMQPESTPPPDAASAERRPPAGDQPMRHDPITLGHYLSLGAMLFALSVIGIFLNRKNLIVLLMAIELMLLAVNMNFVAFSHYLGDMAGQVFVFFILTVAAAESAIGLAILVVLFRNQVDDQRRRTRRAQGLKAST